MLLVEVFTFPTFLAMEIAFREYVRLLRNAFIILPIKICVILSNSLPDNTDDARSKYMHCGIFNVIVSSEQDRGPFKLVRRPEDCCGARLGMGIHSAVLNAKC